MTWVRLADDFTDHPKVVRAGPLAAWLYVCGLTYANRYATDGVIPAAQVPRLAAVTDPERLARRLVEASLWEEVEDGYMIHDYGSYQPSAEEIKRERADAARRQAEYRQRRAEARNAARNGVTHPESDALVTRESRSTRVTGAPWTGPARPGPVNTSGPDVESSPKPPPCEEGASPQTPQGGPKNSGLASPKAAARPRRRGRGEDVPTPPSPPPEVAAPLTPDDGALWQRAVDLAAGTMTTGNADMVRLLAPVGRSSDGGLLLRAPPGLQLARFTGIAASALLEAGDAAARQTQIFEGTT